jgi:hypothetical protein
MISTRSIRDREICAKEGRAEFSHELLDGVRFISEAIREIAVQAALVTCPMGVMPSSA